MKTPPIEYLMLLVKLKRLGFPQTGEGSTIVSEDMCDIYGKDALVLYEPTLSELLKACAGTTIKLLVYADGKAGIQKEEESSNEVVIHNTPEEALAAHYIRKTLMTTLKP